MNRFKIMRFSKLLLGLALLLMAASSCVTSKEVSYLYDLKPGDDIPLNSRFEPVISPNDQLRIVVIGVGIEKELAEPFNPYGTLQTLGNQDNLGYLVDVEGNIQFPIFGTLHVQGMTRLQLQDSIRSRLIAEGHMTDPMVDVRIDNFRVFVLGTSDGGKVLNIQNERCTFLEALAMAGGLDKYTKRDRIAVLREVDGVMEAHYLDPRSTEVFNDPFFLLQQNDIIVTQSFRRTYAQDMLNTSLAMVSATASLVSTITMLYLLLSGKN